MSGKQREEEMGKYNGQNNRKSNIQFISSRAEATQ